MNKVKVVARVDTTINENDIQNIILNGVDAIEINMSDSSRESIRKIISLIRMLNKKLSTGVGIMLSIGEPSIHTGKVKDNETYFKTGDKIRLYIDDMLGDETKVSIDRNIIDEVSRDDNIILNDGSVRLKVYDKGDNYIICEVLKGGNIVSYSKVYIKNDLNAPFLKVKDIKDIEFASEMNVDFVEIPKVKTSEDILEVTDMLIGLKNDHTNVISRIELEEALDDIDNIIKISDGIIIDRNSLAMTLPVERIPGIQKRIINKCLRAGKISIISTDLPKTSNNSLNRIEIQDIANSTIDGVDAFIINENISSKEIISIKLLESILNEVEKGIDYNTMAENASRDENTDITGIIATNVATTANRLKCKAIIAPTITGYTARKISRFRPYCPIIAASPSMETVTSLSLNFGVNAVLIDDLNSLDKIIKISEDITKGLISLSHGDKVIITGGYPFKESKNTNFMKIKEI